MPHEDRTNPSIACRSKLASDAGHRWTRRVQWRAASQAIARPPRRSVGSVVPSHNSMTERASLWSAHCLRRVRRLPQGADREGMTSMAVEETPERIMDHPSFWRNRVSDTSTGKVVVNRSMSLDGFIAGPGHAMDWDASDFVAPNDLREIAAATGAMLIGRRTHEVGKKMVADEPESVDYPFSGPLFVLTHEPPDPPDPGSRSSPVISGKRSPRPWTLRGEEPGDPRRRRGRPVPAARARRRDPGVCDAGAARRRHPLLPRASPGSTWNRSVARGRAPSPSSGSTSARRSLVVVEGSGRRRIRTSVGYAGDFTDRSLWPLGHPPGNTSGG